jgi:DNA polymerase-3 subunit alpha
MDDMRRAKVPVLPPCVNASGAEFSVEPADGGRLAVRYALAGLKNVGEKAMEGLVAERQARGPFASLDDFAHRIDGTAVNKRSLEMLAAAGAFDAIEGNRAALLAGCDTIVAAAQSARATRESGQGGLFGGPGAALAALRLPATAPWSRSEAMGREREAFGFYFSAHPVAEHAAIATANGARSHADLMAAGPVPEGQRRPATMAVLVEKAQRRQSRKGNDFLQLILSDESGQFSASCFDEGAVAALIAMADAGGTALAQVELDQRAGDDAPRITVRSVRPLGEAAVSARLRLAAHVETEAGAAALAALLAPRAGGRGEVVVSAPSDDGGTARLRLAGGYRVDPELADALKGVDGLAAIRVEPIKPQLALVR